MNPDISRKKIYLYGTGKLAAFFMDHYASEYELIAFIETQKTSEHAFNNYEVYSLNELQLRNDEFIFMANTFPETLEILLKAGVPKEKIVLLSWELAKTREQQNDGILDISMRIDIADAFDRHNRMQGNEEPEKYVLTKRMNQDQVQFGKREWGDCHFSLPGMDIVRNDEYCRLGALYLAAEEIKLRGVSGAVAELGVYQGFFAQYINHAFPDRKMFLFDTFEGFVSEEMEHDINAGFLEKKNYFNTVESFTDTGVNLVMNKMSHPENCIIKKGRFPNTLSNELLGEMTFAFVSLDCDLYIPILEGLKYFYPRLSPGGYIFIHDFCNIQGVRQAVSDYESTEGYVARVCIPDPCGSLVITK